MSTGATITAFTVLALALIAIVGTIFAIAYGVRAIVRAITKRKQERPK